MPKTLEQPAPASREGELIKPLRAAIVTRGDPIAASDLADQLTTAAEKPGIPADQINGEIESAFEL
ncbi:hypothetical protein X744_02680 [Mesorhizobium sp. LNJC372A00]|nr:hypothetical protein X744_02680 [Mesorhizobium sp. LNJC372A00]